MKKFISLILIAVVAIALAGCNGSNTPDVTAVDYIDAPTNLTIDGQTLSWDAVTDASGYIVFANDEEVANLKSDVTSYNFSSLQGDDIIFRVQTKAPKGLVNSEKSLSVAYVADKTQEVSQVAAQFTARNMNMPNLNQFATELVNKGMTSTELQPVMTAMDNMMDSNPQSFSDAYDLIDALLSSTTNIEAIVSAVVKVIIPEALQEQLQYATGEEAAMLYSMKNYFTQNPDEAIVAITKSVQYMIQMEQAMSADMISNIEDLTSTDSPQNLNTAELMLVKDEMVSILRDNKPSLNDMELFIEFANTLMNVMNSSVGTTYPIDDYISKSALHMSLSIDLAIDFLDSFKAEYFDGIKAIATNDQSKGEAYMGAEVAALTVKHLATFKSDNQDEFDAIDNVFTDADKEAMFDANIANLANIDTVPNVDLTGVITALQNFDFQKILSLQESMGNTFDTILNGLADSDGAIFKQVAIMSSYQGMYSSKDSSFSNSALGLTFQNQTEMRYSQQQQSVILVKDVFDLLYPAINGIDQEDFTSAVNLVSDMVFAALAAIPENEIDLPQDVDLAAIETAVTTFIDNANGDLFQLVQNLMTFIDDNDPFTEAASVLEDTNSYMIANYGNDYMSSWYYDDYSRYAAIITVAQYYSDFMNAANRQLVDNVVLDGATMITSSAFAGMNMGTDPTTYTDLVDAILDNMMNFANTIKNYDYDNLTPEQRGVIDNFNPMGSSSPAF